MRPRAVDDLTDIVIQIIDAGFPVERANPWLIYVFDAEGRPWPVPARLMGRDEILRYVEQRFGATAASYVAATPALTLH